MSLPPDFKKKITKVIQDRSDSQQRRAHSQIDYKNLESIIPGQIIKVEPGEFYMVRRELKELYSNAEVLVKRYCDLFVQNIKINYGSHKMDNELRKLLITTPAKAMFLDTETSGFSSNPVFLIGVMHFNGENFLIDQLFARDYSEETILLEYFSHFAPMFDTVLTFNGKSFDVPFIRDRMIYHRKKFHWTHNHVDILHHSRRRWKGELPDCKLQTLENYICNRQRVGDIPSALVPSVYQEFVRSGDARLLADIFHHNALDLITLVELTILLLT
jgi:uncharacterized protein YprB with RNaseH-like and TPR domain